jgi:hypothetical protein
LCLLSLLFLEKSNAFLEAGGLRLVFFLVGTIIPVRDQACTFSVLLVCGLAFCYLRILLASVDFHGRLLAGRGRNVGVAAWWRGDERLLDKGTGRSAPGFEGGNWGSCRRIESSDTISKGRRLGSDRWRCFLSSGSCSSRWLWGFGFGSLLRDILQLATGGRGGRDRGGLRLSNRRNLSRRRTRLGSLRLLLVLLLHMLLLRYLGRWRRWLRDRLLQWLVP